MRWQLEVFENGVWRKVGEPTTDFKKLYEMSKKYAENGRKARVAKA